MKQIIIKTQKEFNRVKQVEANEEVIFESSKCDPSYLLRAVSKLTTYKTPEHVINRIKIIPIYGNPPFGEE